jgi:hypothetical protein
MNDVSERRRAEQEELADRFEALLGDHGITILTGSRLEQALLLPRLLKHIREDDAPLPELSAADEDDMFRRAAWLWAMIPRLLEATGHQSFRELVPHLKLVVAGEFAQNVAGDRDEDSDKLFELVVALAILPYARNLKMDTGDAAARNPDLLFDFEGTRWGVACKALYTSRPERYRDSVINGASQIERSDAARGVVCVTLRNLIDHAQFLPRDGELLVGMSKVGARKLLAEEEARITRETIDPVKQDIGAAFAARPKVERAVLHVSAVCARTGTPTDVRMTYMARLMEVGRIDTRFADALNAGLQALQPPLP